VHDSTIGNDILQIVSADRRGSPTARSKICRTNARAVAARAQGRFEAGEAQLRRSLPVDKNTVLTPMRFPELRENDVDNGGCRLRIITTTRDTTRFMDDGTTDPMA